MYALLIIYEKSVIIPKKIRTIPYGELSIKYFTFTELTINNFEKYLY